MNDRFDAFKAVFFPKGKHLRTADNRNQLRHPLKYRQTVFADSLQNINFCLGGGICNDFPFHCMCYKKVAAVSFLIQNVCYNSRVKAVSIVFDNGSAGGFRRQFLQHLVIFY